MTDGYATCPSLLALLPTSFGRTFTTGSGSGPVSGTRLGTWGVG
jgi:hypothetical protein